MSGSSWRICHISICVALMNWRADIFCRPCHDHFLFAGRRSSQLEIILFIQFARCVGIELAAILQFIRWQSNLHFPKLFEVFGHIHYLYLAGYHYSPFFSSLLYFSLILSLDMINVCKHLKTSVDEHFHTKDHE